MKKILFALLPLVTFAQGITGIRSGFVFDAQARAIRPVNGIPGAARLGERIDLGVSLDRVEFLRGSDIAFASATDRFYRVTLSTGSAEPIDGVAAGGRLVAAGIVWVETARTIQFLHDLSRSVVVSEGELTAAALQPETNCALLAFSAGNIESVCGGQQSRIFSDAAARITRIAVSSGSIVALDSANNRILRVGGDSPAAELVNGLAGPVGLAAISDTLFAVAEAGAQRLSFVSIGGAVLEPVSLRFVPTELNFLGTHILRLGEAGAQPFEVVDLSQDNRNFFVPAIAPVANSMRAGN